MQELKNTDLDSATFPPEVLEWIANENLWNLWVPKAYGGLEVSLTEGLKKLKTLAKWDASLGWTLTLCSGANYFIGNLQPEVAREIFIEPASPVVFGGSGGVFGTADRQGDHYRIRGTWRYATGAPYLTHFTLNARITENGKELQDQKGSQLVRSFLIPREEVQIIEDWNTMGLKASATHSFEVKDVVIHQKYSFLYDQFYLPHPIFKIPFSVFADLTLWVNYLGMAEHFQDEIDTATATDSFTNLKRVISASSETIEKLSEEVEEHTEKGIAFTEACLQDIHQKAVTSVRSISKGIIEAYPFLGVNASRQDHPLNRIFRDYFTATQHHIFTKKR